MTASPGRDSGPPLRVLHVLGELRSSGAEMMLAAGADEWRRHGISTTVLAASSTPGSFAGGLAAQGHDVLHLSDQPLAAMPVRLARVLRRVDPDVVHVHTERANFWVALVARLMGKRVVRTVHTGFEFQGRLRVERRIQRRLLAAIGVSSVAVSQAVAANEWQRFANSAHLIENWIDDARFRLRSAEDRDAARRRLGLPPGAHVLVTVGNCSAVKRHDLVLAALPLAAGRVGPIVYLHLGEEDPTSGERELAERVEQVVRFLGPGDPLPVLHAADVFVMPSTREGLGVACAEALAVGVPAVVTDVPGLREFGKYGDVVQVAAATPGAIADAIVDALGSPPGAGRAADVSTDVRRRFSLRRGVADQVACYRSVDGRRPAAVGRTGRVVP